MGLDCSKSTRPTVFGAVLFVQGRGVMNTHSWQRFQVENEVITAFSFELLLMGRSVGRHETDSPIQSGQTEAKRRRGHLDRRAGRYDGAAGDI
jgi:hypothetical protein